jgi:hypothetical protein
VAWVLLRLLLHPECLLLARRRPMEGDPGVLRMETQIGRLLELLRHRNAYDRSIQEALQRQQELRRKRALLPRPALATELPGYSEP